jgi:putative transposase
VVTPAARRDAVAQVRTLLEVSERRACAMIAVDRSLIRYSGKRPDDEVLRARLRELADQRRRFGYPLADRRMEHSP